MQAIHVLVESASVFIADRREMVGDQLTLDMTRNKRKVAKLFYLLQAVTIASNRIPSLSAFLVNLLSFFLLCSVTLTVPVNAGRLIILLAVILV